MSERYDRQLIIQDIKAEGQLKLAQSSVLIIGAGGLGSAAIYYMAAAGIGKISIMDADDITESNLNRQILYSTYDISKSKAAMAAERVRVLNPEISVDGIAETIDEINCDSILPAYDLILDCVDNDTTREMVNRACLKHGVPLIEAGVSQYSGYILPVLSGGPCFACAGRQGYGKTRGVLGAAAGVIGSMQVLMGIRLILGYVPATVLTVFNGITFSIETITVKRDPYCSVCSGII